MATLVIALANQNGGVGKTTTTINLGAALFEEGERVLLIDLDPQGTLTLAHGLASEGAAPRPNIYHVLVEGRDIREAIIKMERAPDIVPADIDLAGAEVELLGELGRESYLKDSIQPLTDSYQFILLDCPPSLSLLTINALVAADAVILPVATHYLRFLGMNLLLSTIEKVNSKFNPKLTALRILPTMFQTRTLHSREILNNLQAKYNEQVFNTVIKYTVRLAQAPARGMSLVQAEGLSPHAEAYRQLAKEVKLWLNAEQQRVGEEMSSLRSQSPNN